VLESVVRGGLAALVVGLLGGVVSTQYVGAQFFSVVTPFLTGVACGVAALMAARPASSRARTYVRLVAAGLAIVGAAYGFRFVPGGESALHPAGRVVPPYVAAAAGVWLWTLPPRRPREDGPQRGMRRK
jgi:hypothetical protein